MLNVGLTGGIACGKSTVAHRLMEKGAFLIDTDILVHRLEAPGEKVWQAIVDHFGEAILQADQTINRRRLGAIVFSDTQARETLNRLVHPAVQEERRRRLLEISSAHRSAIVLSDVPLLFETGMQGEFDLVLLVYLAPQAQIDRLMARDGFSRAEAEARLASQWPIDAKVPLADFIIRNDGSPRETQQQIDEVWVKLLKRESKIGALV